MKIVIGLGNPGKQYERTRHNVGFAVIDEIARRLGVVVRKSNWRALTAQTQVAAEKVWLCKPQTFMNLSGDSVREAVDWINGLDVARDLIVVHDDMDLPLGHVRLRQQGGAGGHNGIKSIIAALGTQTFSRIRLGIDHPADKADVIAYVLQPFALAQRDSAEAMVNTAADAVLAALEDGFTTAMNRFNGV